MRHKETKLAFCSKETFNSQNVLIQKFQKKIFPRKVIREAFMPQGAQLG